MTIQKLAILVGSIGLLVLLLSAGPSTDLTPSTGGTIFERHEGWGPCPDDEICIQKTFLHEDGKLVFTGKKEGQVDVGLDVVNQVQQKIEELDLLKRNCPDRGEVMDYWASYSISQDGYTREFTFPLCDIALGELEQLIPEID